MSLTQSRPPVTILTSGIGLGVYIPALLIERQLNALAVNADVEVIEGYYTAGSLRRHIAFREASRQNFALAQMANRMTRPVLEHLDMAAVDALLTRWAEQRRTEFIVWAGFWLPILEDYRRRVPGLRIRRDLCRIDAEVSPSFKVHQTLEGDGTPIWLWNVADMALHQEIPVTREAPVPFGQRGKRLVVHGGGWGLGTYAKALPLLAAAGYALDIVVHDPGERRVFGPHDRCWMTDPDWEPWHRDAAARLAFPAVGAISADGTVSYTQNESFHGFHRVIRNAVGIVSKPGGCTLIDSLAAATPVILLEPYSGGEKANRLLWERHGFGIQFQDWAARGFDAALLEQAHAALLRHPRRPGGYPEVFAQALAAREIAA